MPGVGRSVGERVAEYRGPEGAHRGPGRGREGAGPADGGADPTASPAARGHGGRGGEEAQGHGRARADIAGRAGEAAGRHPIPEQAACRASWPPGVIIPARGRRPHERAGSGHCARCRALRQGDREAVKGMRALQAAEGSGAGEFGEIFGHAAQVPQPQGAGHETSRHRPQGEKFDSGGRGAGTGGRGRGGDVRGGRRGCWSAHQGAARDGRVAGELREVRPRRRQDAVGERGAILREGRVRLRGATGRLGLYMEEPRARGSDR
mmetsp:Transcript_85603/g.239102  ORF Transcript_85603/g.239102 Transcript_85603/m.239102 type:complete len:264 (+) Transcript_85603:530-1321(+)